MTDFPPGVTSWWRPASVVSGRGRDSAAAGYGPAAVLTAANGEKGDGGLILSLPASEAPYVQNHADPPGVRWLGPEDVDRLAEFRSRVPAADVDEAYVELAHWFVVGMMEGSRIVAAASAYPWRSSGLADIGVVTRPDRRGRGHATSLTIVLARAVMARGYWPQYRCDTANAASARVAASAGFSPLGIWSDAAP